MSELKNPPRCFLLASVLYRKDKFTQKKLINVWEKLYGPSLYFYHPFCPMKAYYAPEMGPEEDLERFFLVSTKLYPRSVLVKAKLWAAEKELTTYRALNKRGEGKQNNPSRWVNWDVGTLSLENLQLATGKNFTHRVYLQKGVFSDLTLIFQGKSYAPLPWSYPDYSHPEVIEFLNYCRKFLQLNLLSKK